MSCTESKRIIQTGIITKEKVCTKLLSGPKHLITPLCESHYKKKSPFGSRRKCMPINDAPHAMH